MTYLVDGNNVMARARELRNGMAVKARRRLIEDLVRFVATHKTKVKVVFDGHPDADFPEGRIFKSVQILYARSGSDADSRIKELLRKSTHKRDIIVVSSDKDLVSFADRQGARVLAAHKFRAILEEARKHSPEEKSGAGEAVDVEEWLDFFGKREEDRP